jgi:hypothetical protein
MLLFGGEASVRLGMVVTISALGSLGCTHVQRAGHGESPVVHWDRSVAGIRVLGTAERLSIYLLGAFGCKHARRGWGCIVNLH